MYHPNPSRRRFVRNFAIGAAGLWVPGAFAEALTQTAKQGAGPFYPVDLPLDTDNDLIVINDLATPALGQITHLSGRILGPTGAPIRNALVEIWQVDHHGVYLHEGSAGGEKRDANFQGFGRFLTGTAGEYYFRTIKPVAYPGRTPHIHFAVKLKGREKWTTQLYIKGEPQNEKDGLIRRIKDDAQRESVIREFAPVPGSKTGDLAAKFDIVMGFTPGDM
jgi:protocatechuate 3,4-dioxygenase beta subunit